MKSFIKLLVVVILVGLSMPAMGQSTGGKTMDTAYIPSYAKTPILKWQSKKMLNGKPMWNGFLLVKAKLNGVYDISGGLQEEETFNIGKIDVWGTNDDPRLHMDLHQSQIRLWSERQTKDGPFVGYLEMDAWGGNNSIRLRHLWFDYKFMHIGQDWSFFGDKDIWPNVLDWDGPPSGVWVRQPMIKFYWETKREWKYEVGVETPGAEITFSDQIDPNLMPSYQNIPDFIATIQKRGGFGHVRLATIARVLKYKNAENLNSTMGYGASLSGLIKTSKTKRNTIQFQATGGVGISAYLVSFGGVGLNYDAVVTDLGTLSAVPSFGSWIAYEHFFTDKWHANVIYGFSDFITSEISHFETGGPQYPAVNTTVSAMHNYLLFNLMFDPIPGLTIGIEYNIGNKNVEYKGAIYKDDLMPLNFYGKDRTAQRISFGAFFDF